jgi:protein TonB
MATGLLANDTVEAAPAAPLAVDTREGPLVPVVTARHAPFHASFLGMVASVALHLAAIAAIVLMIETSDPDPAWGQDAMVSQLERSKHWSDPDPAWGQDAMEVEVILAEPAIHMPDVPQPDAPNLETKIAAHDDPPTPVEHPEQHQDSKVQDAAPDADIVLPTPAEPEQRPAVMQLAAAPAEAPQVVQEESRAVLSDAYRSKVARHLARFKRFPAGAANGRARSGKVLIAFDLAPDGTVLHTALIQSSGNPAFDAEAQAMIRRAQPYPVDDRAAKSRLSFVVPVSYRLWN